MSIVIIDDKNRVRIPKKFTKIARINPGDKVLIFASLNRINIVPLRDKKFIGSLDDVNYNEEDHEASKYLLKRKNRS